MDDNELHTIVVIERRMVGVQARAARAAGEQEQYEGEVKGFHGRRHYAEDDNATV